MTWGGEFLFRNKVRISSLILAFSVVAVAMTSCLKDDTTTIIRSEGETKVSLNIGALNIIETYSSASSEECMIEDAYLLVFKSSGTYKTGEKVLLSAIDASTLNAPVITTELGLADGDKVVVLCNTGVTAMPTFASTDTFSDINTKFTSALWDINRTGANSGKGLPMSGEATWNNATPPTIEMRHSVAKVQLLLDFSSGVDKTSSFTTAADAVEWGMCNYVKEGNVYSAGTTMSVPTSFTYVYSYVTNQRVVGATGATAEQITYYVPEYPAATKAKGLPVASNTFHKDRPCLIVHTSAGYYRIDLATGNANDQTKTFLDIKRNSHYKVTIKNVKSAGYFSAPEALQNPASNLEYEVVITGDKDNMTTSNGQYAVTSDKAAAVVTENITAAEDLVRFRCEANGMADVTTRTIRLVGADKNTLIPTTQLQLCLADGTPIPANTMTFTSALESGYQLKYTSPASASLPAEPVYVEIVYGNVRHYVPVNAYVFKVVAPSGYAYTGETKQYTMTSYRDGSPRTPVSWTMDAFSEDGGATWSALPLPSWITAFTISSTGDTTATPYNATIAAQTFFYPHDDVLKAADDINVKTGHNPYNLSNSSGAATVQNTANCYIVNAPGTYSLPLVYGNAIKNGAPNSSAYHTSNSGDHILSDFIKHDGNPITSPYISGATTAELIWQDAEGLVSMTATPVSGTYPNQKLTFSVPSAKIIQGNAVIAVKNASNQVLWNWHIWVTDYNETDYPARKFTNTTPKDYYFMPINVGWCYGFEYPARSVKVRFTQDESGYTRTMDLNQLFAQLLGNSPYYQWGRKDPFVGGLEGDRMNKTWYDGTGTKKVNTDPVCVSWTIPMDATAAQSFIQTCILNPGTYCTNSYMDWYYYNLWSANNTDDYYMNDNDVVKTVYDPSPVGYHLPAPKAFDGFSNASPSAWDAINKSWTFAKDGNTVNFPHVGMRISSNGWVLSVGQVGFYWSAIPDAGMMIQPHLLSTPNISTFARGYGFSVRPVKD